MSKVFYWAISTQLQAFSMDQKFHPQKIKTFAFLVEISKRWNFMTTRIDGKCSHFRNLRFSATWCPSICALASLACLDSCFAPCEKSPGAVMVMVMVMYIWLLCRHDSWIRMIPNWLAYIISGCSILVWRKAKKQVMPRGCKVLKKHMHLKKKKKHKSPSVLPPFILHCWLTTVNGRISRSLWPKNVRHQDTVNDFMWRLF